MLCDKHGILGTRTIGASTNVTNDDIPNNRSFDLTDGNVNYVKEPIFENSQLEFFDIVPEYESVSSILMLDNLSDLKMRGTPLLPKHNIKNFKRNL